MSTNWWFEKFASNSSHATFHHIHQRCLRATCSYSYCYFIFAFFSFLTMLTHWYCYVDVLLSHFNFEFCPTNQVACNTIIWHVLHHANHKLVNQLFLLLSVLHHHSGLFERICPHFALCPIIFVGPFLLVGAECKSQYCLWIAFTVTLTVYCYFCNKHSKQV